MSENDSISLTEVQIIIGAKELEMFKLKQSAEEVIIKLQAELKAVKAECERLRLSNLTNLTPECFKPEANPVEPLPADL